MENLENLDNKTLRAKCVEYGLPDVPVTDTSKKLLIKRLRAAIEGSGRSENTSAADKQKSRRETIHGTKSRTSTPSERSKEKSKSPSRRTVDYIAGAPTELSGKSSPVPAQITQKRRSGRITPSTQSEPILYEPVKAKLKSTTTIQEESDDIVWIEDDKTNSRPASRQSRAPSLSTSPTVTTTYTHVLAEPIQQTKEQEEEEEWVDNAKAKFEVFEPRYTQKSAYTCGPKEPYVESKTTIIPEREQYYVTSRVSQFGFPRPSLVSTAPRITSYDSVTKISTRSSNRRHTNVGGAYDITSPLAYGSSGHSSSTYQNLIREDSGDEPEPESPYLSDFARRLSKLKAEPVDGGVSRLRRELTQKRDLPLRRSGIKNMGRQESIRQSLRQFFMALDQNYDIKRKFYIIAGIAMLIFIYVFFFN